MSAPDDEWDYNAAVDLKAPHEEEWDESAARDIPQYSKGLSALTGATQGASLGFMDELAGARQAAGSALTRGVSKVLGPKAGAIAAFIGGGTDPSAIAKNLAASQGEGSILGDYRSTRDEARQVSEDARAANPKSYLAGEIAGGVAVPVPGGAALKGASLAGRLGKAALQGAGVGAAYGLGSSKADLTRGEYGRAALDTTVGGLVGAGAGAAGKGAGELVGAGLGKLRGAAVEKIAGLDNDLLELASAAKAEKAAEASGHLGSERQQGNRIVENLMRLENNLSPAQKAELDAMKASGKWDELISQLADSSLEALPGKVAAIDSRKAALTAIQQQGSEAYLKEVSNPLNQIIPRLKRYAAPLAGSLLGPLAGGAVGAVAGGIPGGLAGAGSRPALQAIGRMALHPSVKKIPYRIVERLTRTSPQALGRYAKPLTEAAGRGEQQLAATYYVLTQKFPEFKKLVDGFAQSEPESDQEALSAR